MCSCCTLHVLEVECCRLLQLERDGVFCGSSLSLDLGPMSPVAWAIWHSANIALQLGCHFVHPWSVVFQNSFPRDLGLNAHSKRTFLQHEGGSGGTEPSPQMIALYKSVLHYYPIGLKCQGLTCNPPAIQSLPTQAHANFLGICAVWMDTVFPLLKVAQKL